MARKGKNRNNNKTIKAEKVVVQTKVVQPKLKQHRTEEQILKKREKNRLRRLKQKERKGEAAKMAPPKEQRERFSVNAPGVISSSGTQETAAMSDLGKAWVYHYLDPCGTHHPTVCSRRIPDEAVPESAAPGWRFLDTLYRPNQKASETETTGKNGSWIFYKTPMLRIAAIIIFNGKSKEFTQARMIPFCVAWANSNAAVDPSSVTYPNWYAFEVGDEEVDEEGRPLPENYFTVLAYSALSLLLPPDEMGNSTTVLSFRFTGDGLTIHHNTPTLFDQATVASARFPANTSVKAVADSTVTGFNRCYLTLSVAGAAYNIVWTGVDGIRIPALEHLNYTGVIPSPLIVSEGRIRNPSGSFFTSVGDELRYVVVLGASNFIALSNTTTGESVRIGGFVGSYFVTQFYYRFTENAEDERTEIISYDDSITILALPPSTQADLMQQDPSAYAGLMKENKEHSGGLYLVNQKFQPFFFLAKATDYRKVVFTTRGVKLSDLEVPGVGWYDTIDVNFGIAVGNVQTMPYAAAPLVKNCRGDEQVAGPDSILGGFLEDVPPEDKIALEVADDLMKKVPHGMPADYNGLGTMFSIVAKTMAGLAIEKANPLNVSRLLTDVVNHAFSDVVSKY